MTWLAVPTSELLVVIHPVHDLLTGPWRTVVGPIHPDDGDSEAVRREVAQATDGLPARPPDQAHQ